MLALVRPFVFVHVLAKLKLVHRFSTWTETQLPPLATPFKDYVGTCVSEFASHLASLILGGLFCSLMRMSTSRRKGLKVPFVVKTVLFYGRLSRL